jgi:hypothetical protein
MSSAMRRLAPQRTLSRALLVVVVFVFGSKLARANEAEAYRAECEAAIAAEQAGGRPGSSKLPCRNAFVQGDTSRDMRNEVSSMLAPGVSPSLDDLAVATLVADASVRMAPEQPWGYLARCTVARRLGNADVLKACLRDLRAVAPNDPQTARELAMAPEPVSLGVWLARCGLALLLLATLVHAISKSTSARQRRLGTRVRMAAAFALAASLVSVTPLHAQQFGDEMSLPPDPSGRPDPRADLSKLKINDADPESSIPTTEQRNKGPLQFGYFLQDLVDRAEKASKRGDHAAAARYYRALSKASPDVVVGPRLLCVELELGNDIPDAIKACRTALTLGGTRVADYTRFVQLALKKPDGLSDLEGKELYAVLDHMAQGADLGKVVPTLRCEVALRVEDAATLATCTGQLEKLAPNDPKTVSFAWALALHERDRGEAERLIARAREIGMSADGVAKMEAATSAMARRKLGRFVLLGLVVVVAGVAVMFGTRRLRGPSAVSA